MNTPQKDGFTMELYQVGAFAFTCILLVTNIRIIIISSSFQFANLFVNFIQTLTFFILYYLLSLAVSNDIYGLYVK